MSIEETNARKGTAEVDCCSAEVLELRRPLPFVLHSFGGCILETGFLCCRRYGFSPSLATERGGCQGASDADGIRLSELAMHRVYLEGEPATHGAGASVVRR